MAKLQAGHLLLFLAAALVLPACDDPDSGERRQASDAGAADGPADAQPADSLRGDDGLSGDAAPPNDDGGLVPMPCVEDRDCGEVAGVRAYCEAGACAPAPASPFVETIADGITRAAGARLDITPGYLERWTDRAGPDCPENRPGRYDGPRGPDDVCADSYTDANDDGRFDAIWLGGGDPERPATGVDNENPPSGRVLVLTRDDAVRVVVTYDVHAIDAARVIGLQRQLGHRLGIPASSIIIHATGSRHGPDAVGLWGPGTGVGGGPVAFFARAGASLGLLGSVPYATGVDPAWWRTLVDQTATAIRRAGAAVEPVTTRHATALMPIESTPFSGPIEVPDANEDGRRNDAYDLAAYRQRPAAFSISEVLPGRRDRQIHVLSLDPLDGGAPVAVLLGWGAASAFDLRTDGRLSAGFPGQVRQLVEAEHPGAVALWLTSAGSDTVVVDERVFIPEVSAAGQLVDEEGRVVDALPDAAAAAEPAAALARYIGHAALSALAAAEILPTEMTTRSRFAWVPVRNPRFGLAARLGVLDAFGAWLSAREVTTAWSSGMSTPACGGLGCVRYRLDRLTLGEVTLLTVPGGLADGFVRGQEDARITYADHRELLDLDGDGLADADDPEIRVLTRGGGRETIVTIPAPLNPQRFDPINGLARDQVWLVGRTNGGVGTLGSAWSTPNVFEGALESLSAFAGSPENAAINLCTAGYPCSGELLLGALSSGAREAQPAVLADLPGAYEIWLSGVDFGPAEMMATPWVIEDAEGAVVAEGERLVLGPGNRAHTRGTNLVTAGVKAGDRLRLVRAGPPPPPDEEEPPDPEEGEAPPEQDGWRIGGVVAPQLARHPNAGDAWDSISPDGGDIVYNVACELIFADACPYRLALPGPDPNQSLPRAP